MAKNEAVQADNDAPAAEIARFWMVWNVDGGAPRYQHYSKAAANAEAKRLAECHPKQTFIVLQSVGAFRAEVEPVKAVKLIDSTDPDNGIPF